MLRVPYFSAKPLFPRCEAPHLNIHQSSGTSALDLDGEYQQSVTAGLRRASCSGPKRYLRHGIARQRSDNSGRALQ